MARYVDADLLEKRIRDYADKKCCNGETELANGILKTLSVLKEQPTADVKEVVYGEWKNNWISTDEDLNGYYDGNFQCSECFEVSEEPTDFCPNCGADMRGVRRK